MSTFLIGVDGRGTDAVAFGTHLATATGARTVEATVAGRPAPALHDLAIEQGADLVIVGPTHTGRFGRVLPGATGERLLHDAPYAVAVVPHGYAARPVERIGVAYDGTPSADAAVAAAAGLARTFDAVLEVIGVAEPELGDTPGFVDGHALVAMAQDAERRVDATLEAVVRELPYGVRARPVRLNGEPATVLARRSAQLDLLVTGTRGFGPLRAVLTFAVSGRVQRTAACPVIAVPQTFNGRIAGAINVASASPIITAMSA